ncbi:LacI family DNA-binding transcriptional regulator [Paraburkholderia caballeronis]|uniref:LacI family DNA-binding transcriptional regulator n=1 Tax=Paraburkholderia caballeronis TaxID=416943 RepID=UPI0010656717|nr:substrate-binding domain-containing protein [Paraburkholderia caballeronis]TDV04371.1 LacI family transcriptional regulator [Paraburkholderia caballeronis]TDV17729.1 LacI family transcriptional regulator [Paraburkholderia caballeronis]TDV18759.1 LacI family transcriptional regulator [Paraburkholderia caballeronis]TDV35537.1 LacI family transcriptional regulator [Paraburkholderia caballeronis]
MQKKSAKTVEPPASRTITMRDVAREADVSLGTVSRVVNKHPAVKPGIRQRVEAAIATTGWQPNAVAQSMRTASTKMIGCVLPDTSNPLFVAVAKGAEQVLREHGYAFVLANSNSDVERDLELLNLLLQRRVDGLLFAPSDEYDPRILSLLERTRTPTVLIERELSPDCDYVASNQCNGIRQAVDYLLSIGHTRIALVTGQQRIRPGRERYRGFVQAFDNAGIAFDPALVRLDSMDAAYAYREVQRLMEMPEPPTAIIMGGNLMLPGALRACALKDIKVPQDVSIVAVGETDLAELASPPITTVRWNLEAMGREAASIVMDRIAEKPSTDGREPRHVIVPTEIILRRSCAPLRS